MERRYWTLSAIAAAGESGLSPAQLQKSLFLLGEAYPKAVRKDFYTFEPYNYGPFSSDVYMDAIALSKEGLVLIDNPGHTWARRYRATPAGLEKAAALRQGIEPVVSEYLIRVVAWAQRLSFQQLVRAIYDKFPEQREHSVFQE